MNYFANIEPRDFLARFTINYLLSPSLDSLFLPLKLFKSYLRIKIKNGNRIC